MIIGAAWIAACAYDFFLFSFRVRVHSRSVIFTADTPRGAVFLQDIMTWSRGRLRCNGRGISSCHIRGAACGICRVRPRGLVDALVPAPQHYKLGTI